MTLDELKTEISERIESEQDKLNRLNDCKKCSDICPDEKELILNWLESEADSD